MEKNFRERSVFFNRSHCFISQLSKSTKTHIVTSESVLHAYVISRFKRALLIVKLNHEAVENDVLKFRHFRRIIDEKLYSVHRNVMNLLWSHITPTCERFVYFYICPKYFRNSEMGLQTVFYSQSRINSNWTHF